MKVMKSVTKCFMTMFFVVAMFCVTGITVNANEITQTSQTSNSVTVNWPAKEDALEYYVSIGTSYSEASSGASKVTVPGSSTGYTFTGLQAGTEYDVIVEFKKQGYANTYTARLGYISVKTLPAKVTGVNQEKWLYYAKIVYFLWTDQPATDYEYVIRNNKNQVVAKETIGFNNDCLNKVSNTMVYNIQVRAYVTINGTKYYGEWSDKAYLFTQPMVKTAKISGNKLKITWNKVSGVTGYDVYVSTKEKTGYKKVKSLNSKKSSVTISKLKGKKFSSKKTYYMYIVGKKKIGKNTYTSGRLYSYKLTKGKNGQLRWSFKY